MEFVVKNMNGEVLSVLPIKEGYVLEIKDGARIEDFVKEQLEYYVEDIFRMAHERFDINSGDVAPLQQLKLSTETEILAERIADILIEQKGD